MPNGTPNDAQLLATQLRTWADAQQEKVDAARRAADVLDPPAPAPTPRRPRQVKKPTAPPPGRTGTPYTKEELDQAAAVRERGGTVADAAATMGVRDNSYFRKRLAQHVEDRRTERDRAQARLRVTTGKTGLRAADLDRSDLVHSTEAGRREAS